MCGSHDDISTERERTNRKVLSKVRNLSGINEVYSHFTPATFAAGLTMRDENLPEVSIDYIRDVLSLENLAGAPGQPVTIPETHITERQLLLQQYTLAGTGFRRFYFSIGSTSKANHSDEQLNSEAITNNVRKLFKLGPCTNTPRGAPGRMPTAYGSLASAREQLIIAMEAEENKQKLQTSKLVKESARKEAAKIEKPVVQYLMSKGFMKDDERLTKEKMLVFLNQNKELRRNLKLSVASSRKEMVSALLNHIN